MGAPLIEETYFEKGELAAELFKERQSKAAAAVCFMMRWRWASARG
ncbi:MAG: hypothetical protein ACLTSZ_13560 [Lachnospiraceae bacterium]